MLTGGVSSGAPGFVPCERLAGGGLGKGVGGALRGGCASAVALAPPAEFHGASAVALAFTAGAWGVGSAFGPLCPKWAK